MHVIRFKLLCLISVLVTIILSCALGPKQVGSKHKEPSHLWRHGFNGQVLSVYFTPGGMVTAVTQTDSEEEPDHIWYFNSDTGDVIWNGPMDSGALVSDVPLPVFLLLTEDGKADLVCIALDGSGELWRKRTEGEILYAGADPVEKIAFTVTVPKPLSSSTLVQEASISAFSIETGISLSDISLGEISHKYITPDNILSFSDGIAYFVYGGTAAALSISRENSFGRKTCLQLWCRPIYR
jgi:outer membrane protein assembly factor BamB